MLVNSLMNSIDRTIPAILPIKEPQRIIILDAPDYPNVGDPAIFLGEMAFLRRAYPNVRISVASQRTYAGDVDAEIERSDLVFLQGGGNFGSIWPHHQDFRLHILNRFPNKAIVQFPQSITFTEEESLRKTQLAIKQCKRFILLVRDVNGLEYAKKNFDCVVEMCPDMAFAMGPIASPQPKFDYSCLLRTDKESLVDKTAAITGMLAASGATFTVNDWLENRLGVEKVHGLARLFIRGGLPPEVVARHGLFVFELYARSRLRLGISLLGFGRTVVTDRLHGHILATLIGRPRFVFDSLDGKIRAFNDTWLSDDRDAVFLDRVEDLRDHVAARQLAA